MRSKYYFDMTIANLSKISTKAKVYLFAHKMKMDVIPLNKRDSAVESLADIFEIEKFPFASIYGTSIFDDSVWEAMQKVLSFVYPRDDSKTTEIKSIVGNYHLNFLALSTSQGLVLYSEPEVESGINYTRMKNELTKAYFPGMVLSQVIFTFGQHLVFTKELDEDLIITTVFPEGEDVSKSQKNFNSLSTQISTLFKPAELLGRAKVKMKETLSGYLKTKGLKKVDDFERRLDAKVAIQCDVCGKQLQKSLLDVALDNSENIERGIKVTSGFGAASVEMYPIHDCIEGIREVPVILDGNLEYRRYERSRAV